MQLIQEIESVNKRQVCKRCGKEMFFLSSTRAAETRGGQILTFGDAAFG